MLIIDLVNNVLNTVYLFTWNWSMQLTCLDMDWKRTLKQAQLHMNLLEPFVAFRRVLLQILNCQNYTVQHLLESAATLRKVILL